jgi:hypothetical protein
MRSSDLERPGSARRRSRPALAWPVLLVFTLAACADEPTTPKARGDEDGRTGTPTRTLGVVEITISGLGTGQVTSSALSAPTVAELDRLRALRDAAGASAAGPGVLAPQALTPPDHSAGGGDGTIQLELLSTGSFTDGARGAGGYRYLWATYRVRNAQKDGTAYDTPRMNLTFYAVDTDSTINETAISSLTLFDGSPADPALATQLIPTGAVAKHPGSNTIHPTDPDVLQVVTEAEADSIRALAGEGVIDVFPYGFVVQNTSNSASRTLPADPDEDQFDGVVTFAYKVPLQPSPNQDPFAVSVVFLAVDDDEVKLTQAPEEQTPAGRAAFDVRAAALGADVLTLLPPAGDAVLRGGEALRVLCDVRVAGVAGPGATTIFPSAETGALPVPSPFRIGPAFLPPDARLAAASCSAISTVDATTFAVHGSQSGRNLAGTYSGAGSQFVRAPQGRGGRFFPGEVVEVTLTTGLGGAKPVVARYRVAASGGSGTFQLSGGDSLRVGIGPYSVALGDLNGDGALDLVAANYNDDNVSVLLNQGGGSFASHVTYAVGDAPMNVGLGDVDGDGDLDLVTANVFSDNVSVLLNQGDGTFVSHGAYPVGDGPYSVALGDVDGDGDLDLVTVNYYSGNVSVLLNQGDGSFASHGTYPVGNLPTSVALGDVDGDGDLDLVTANRNSNNVSVLLNDGGGTFALRGTYRVGSGPLSVALGDLDGDGDLDLVTTNLDSGNVSVLFNDGGGTFAPHGAYPVGTSPWSVALGDVDGDGDLDLVVANQSSANISVLLNQGDGSFGPHVLYSLVDNTRAVVLGDLDGDGDLDMLVPRSTQSRVSVLLNQ